MHPLPSGWDRVAEFQRLDAEHKLDLMAKLPSDGTALPCLLEALGDPDWRVRKSAVDRVADLPGRQEAADRLIGALSSADNAALRNAAAEALIRLGPSAVAPLLAHVRTTADQDLQKFIVDILGDLDDRRAIPDLIVLTSGTDENVAMAAIEAVGKLKDPRAVGALIDVLRQDRPLVQFSAVKALQELGDGRAIEPLIESLGRKTLERAVLEALGRIGDLRALNPLVQALRLGTTKVRHTAVRALIDLHHRMPSDTKTKIVCRVREVYEKDVSRHMLDGVGSDDPGIKRNAITLLGWMEDVKTIEALAASYDDVCKEEIINAFIRMRHEAVPKLLTLVQRVPDGLREGIARALGEIGDRRAVHVLAALASDSNGHVRQSAATALGRLQDPSGIRPLLVLLDDPYGNVQEAAYEALTRLRSAALVERLLELLDTAKPTVRCYAARLLGFFKVPEAAGRLFVNLNDSDPAVRRTAMAALDALGGEAGDAGDSWRTALNDDDASVRLETVRILAKRTELDVDVVLRPLLQDPDIWVRAEVIRVLSERRRPGLVETLLPMVHDSVGMIVIAVCDALGRLRAREAAPSLIGLLASPDHDVRQAAVAALGEVGGPRVAESAATLLGDPHWGVRAAAVVTLGKIHAVSAMSRIRDLAQQDPDRLVRESAHFALDQLAVAVDQAS